MTMLANFIVVADQLVQFQSSYQELPIVDKSITYLETSKEELKIIWSNIKSCYSACVAEDDQENIESIKAKYRTSSNTYITILSEIIDECNKLKLIKEDEEKLRLNAISNNNNPCIKVPPCDTEIFFGDYLTWPSFRDMFTAVYINHPKLCAVQKLFHLRAKTKGEAYSIVSKFPLTEENFELAWKALSDQYENRRILVNNQIKTLFNLPVLTAESGKDIRDLQRNINDCLSILKAHHLSIDSWDPILVYLCSNRLPESTLSLWEQVIKSPRDIPKWDEMDTFLTNRYRALETVSDLKFSSKPKAQTYKPQSSQLNQKQRHKAFHTKIYNFSCKLCQDSHPLRLCPKFLEMNVDERISKVVALKFCQNCLSPSHEVKTCKSNYHCTVCKKRHHSLLHNSHVQTQSVLSTSTPEFKPQPIQSTAPISSHQVNSSFAQNNQRILLATALINIFHLGNTHTLRALIDSGSEVTLLSEETQRKLRLPIKPIQAQITGMSTVVTAHSTKLCTLCIGSKYIPSFTLSANAIVLEKLTDDLPSCLILPEEVTDPLDFNLADPYFYESSKIDIVIGSDLYPSIISEGVKRDIFGSLIAQNTIFGWVLSGPLRHERFKCNTTILSHFYETSIDEQISKFWEIEEIPDKPIPSHEDEICERLYSETTTRNSEGRYIVRLPFKNSISTLGHSRNIALKQFIRMENSLKKKSRVSWKI
ncbi:uncharacterized protein LOC129939295 [Eupeodes corollae]|uniref:uncharacterized protein LOC129939295 n=1 Tax=Eupeodes corollae TaxID=290404 RepID=UPI002491BA73|nr:uncharacterized protein LOC129939295 [Eupeodes corollae]